MPPASDFFFKKVINFSYISDTKADLFLPLPAITKYHNFSIKFIQIGAVVCSRNENEVISWKKLLFEDLCKRNTTKLQNGFRFIIRNVFRVINGLVVVLKIFRMFTVTPIFFEMYENIGFLTFGSPQMFGKSPPNYLLHPRK